MCQSAGFVHESESLVPVFNALVRKSDGLVPESMRLACENDELERESKRLVVGKFEMGSFAWAPGEGLSENLCN